MEQRETLFRAGCFWVTNCYFSLRRFSKIPFQLIYNLITYLLRTVKVLLKILNLKRIFKPFRYSGTYCNSPVTGMAGY